MPPPLPQTSFGGQPYQDPYTVQPEQFENIGPGSSRIIGPASIAGYTMIRSFSRKDFAQTGRINAPLGLQSVLGVTKAGKTLGKAGFGSALGGGMGMLFWTGNPYLAVGGAVLGSTGGLAQFKPVRESPFIQMFASEGLFKPVKMPWNIKSGRTATDFLKTYNKRLQRFNPLHNVIEARQAAIGRIRTAYTATLGAVDIPPPAYITSLTGGYAPISGKKLDKALNKILPSADEMLGQGAGAFGRLQTEVASMATARAPRSTLDFLGSKQFGKLQSKVKSIGDATAYKNAVTDFTKTKSFLAQKAYQEEAANWYKYKSKFRLRGVETSYATKGFRESERMMGEIKKYAGKNKVSMAVATEKVAETRMLGAVRRMGSTDLKKLATSMGVDFTDATKMGTLRREVTKTAMARGSLIGGMTKLAKIGGAIYTVGMLKDLGVMAAQAGVGLMRTVGSTLDKMTKMEFGGEVVKTQAASTERQRALQAMSNSTLNARQFIGAEANLLHN